MWIRENISVYDFNANSNNGQRVKLADLTVMRKIKLTEGLWNKPTVARKLQQLHYIIYS